jgi:putative acetyltransferase
MLIEPTPTDVQKIIELIDGVYREYGDSICLENADSDLLAIDKNYSNKGGVFRVWKENDEITATIAVVPADEKDAVMLKRLYLKENYRGSGTANLLLNFAIEWAKERGYKEMNLWSDTRFLRGHQFYMKHKFIRNGIRSMNDGNMPYKEYFFSREI